MKSFRNRVLTEAVALRAASAQLPEWLREARDALAEFHSADGGNAARLGERFAAIKDWPREDVERDLALRELSEPIVKLLSNAFCKIDKNKAGRPSATLWGGAAAVEAQGGGLRFESARPEIFEKSSAHSLFDHSNWNGGAGSREDGAFEEAVGIRMARAFESFSTLYEPYARGTEEELMERPAPEAVKAGVKGRGKKKKAGGPSEDDISGAVARGLLGLESGPGVEDDLSRVRQLRRLKEMEELGVLMASPPLLSASSLFASHRELAEGLEEKAAPPVERPTGDEPSQQRQEGWARALRLSDELTTLGRSVLSLARADAGVRLVSFMEDEAPGSGSALFLAREIWGLPMGMTAARSASAWVGTAKRVMREDPRRSLLALAIAPDLGLSPNLDLLAQTKAALKEAGLPESVWKEMGALPEKDFETLLKGFKETATRSAHYGDRGGMRIMYFDSPRLLQKDPFEGAQPSPASPELRRQIQRCVFAKEVATLAGMSLSSAIGFCLSEDPASSPAWAKEGSDKESAFGAMRFMRRQAAEQKLMAIALGEKSEDEDYPDYLEHPIRGEGNRISASERAQEQAAARAKAPRILALAMQEARKGDLRRARDELEDLADWLTRSEHGVWQQLPEKMSWASLRRREQAWHKELQAAKDAEFQKPWERALEAPIEAGGLIARELPSGQALFEEGKAMRHCVSSYAQDCRAGDCRIYSIANDKGERLATLEAGFDGGLAKGGQARVAQLRGFANARVEDPAVIALSERIIQELNQTLAARAAAAKSSSEAPSLLPALASRRRDADGPAEREPGARARV